VLVAVKGTYRDSLHQVRDKAVRCSSWDDVCWGRSIWRAGCRSKVTVHLAQWRL